MHELGITDQLLTLTLRHAEEAGAKRVTRLNLVIGEFSSVVDESIKFYWDMLAKDTIAAEAKLCFERVPGLLECGNCRHRYTLAELEVVCPVCGMAQSRVVDGDQFRLASIEIE
nr:hydrogenase maturation nickel metallochaperone HypA [Anaerolineae bacterium]